MVRYQFRGVVYVDRLSWITAIGEYVQGREA
jgi:hypothetical protein